MAARRTLVAPCLLSALFLVVLACSRPPADPVRAVLDGVARAAEARDAGAVGEFLSETFRDADGHAKAETIDLVRRTLAGYEKISLTLSDVVLERGVGVARAAFRLKMSGKPRAVGGLEGFLPRESTWRFELRIALEEKTWKITSAGWSQAGENP